MLEIISIVIAVYIITILINLYYIKKAYLFNLKLDWKFTLLYLLFSPIVLPFTIGKAFATWYEELMDDRFILKGIRMGIENTKYDVLTDAQIMELKDILADNEQYASFDCFEDIFDDLARRGILVPDREGHYNIVNDIEDE